MSGYLPELRFETEYEGEQVVVRLKPLSRATFIRVMPHLTNLASEKDAMKLFEVSADMLRDVVIDVDGLLDGHRRAVDKDTMINDAYFADLCFKTMWFSLNTSIVGKLKRLGSEERLQESIEVPE